MIVYVYEASKPPAFYTAGWKDRKDIDTLVIQFVNTTGGYNWDLSEIVNSRIVKILRNKKSIKSQSS